MLLPSTLMLPSFNPHDGFTLIPSAALYVKAAWVRVRGLIGAVGAGNTGDNANILRAYKAFRVACIPPCHVLGRTLTVRALSNGPRSPDAPTVKGCVDMCQPSSMASDDDRPQVDFRPLEAKPNSWFDSANHRNNQEYIDNKAEIRLSRSEQGCRIRADYMQLVRMGEALIRGSAIALLADYSRCGMVILHPISRILRSAKNFSLL
jgi:hypothetical protein